MKQLTIFHIKYKVFKSILVLSVFMSKWTNAANAQDVTINKIWTEQNAYQNGVQGIKIHCSFTAYGMQGKEGCCDVPVCLSNGDALMKQGTYHNHFASQKFYPSNQSASYNDFILFISYNDLRNNLSHGSYSLKLCVVIGCEEMLDWPMSDYVNFKIDNNSPTTNNLSKTTWVHYHENRSNGIKSCECAFIDNVNMRITNYPKAEHAKLIPKTVNVKYYYNESTKQGYYTASDGAKITFYRSGNSLSFSNGFIFYKK